VNRIDQLAYLVRFVKHNHLAGRLRLQVPRESNPEENAGGVSVHKRTGHVHDGDLARFELRFGASVLHV